MSVRLPLRRQRTPRESLAEDTEKLLLDLVRVDNEAASPVGALRGGRHFDAAYLLSLAYQEGLAPLVYESLRTREGGVSADIPVSRFGYIYGLTRRRNEALLGQLAEILAEFDRRSIGVIVLKGAALAEPVYGDLALRPMADLDVLVKQEDLDRAHDALLSLGYTINFQGKAIDRPSDSDRAYRKARQYFHLNRDFASVDPHWQLVQFPLLLDVDYGLLWQRARPATLGGVEARVLCPEDTLVHLALDFTKGWWHGQPELKTLRDMAEVIRRHAIDWDDLLETPVSKAARSPLHYALVLAHRLVGAEIPEPVLRRIEAALGHVDRWQIRYLETHVLRHGHPLRYAVSYSMMRLLGSESVAEKLMWTVRLMIPPRVLWGGVPRTLRRVFSASGSVPS